MHLPNVETPAPSSSRVRVCRTVMFSLEVSVSLREEEEEETVNTEFEVSRPTTYEGEEPECDVRPLATVWPCCAPSISTFKH